jgi:hypothetical protein
VDPRHHHPDPRPPQPRRALLPLPTSRASRRASPGQARRAEFCPHLRPLRGEQPPPPHGQHPRSRSGPRPPERRGPMDAPHQASNCPRPEKPSLSHRRRPPAR